jgi:hypothetical protein
MKLQLLAVPLAALLRNVAGWLENSLKDGKISKYEWGKLGATILRVGALGLAIYYGFNLSEYQSAGVAVVADFIIHAIRKKRTK